MGYMYTCNGVLDGYQPLQLVVTLLVKEVEEGEVASGSPFTESSPILLDHLGASAWSF